jgi:hypothetical protein
MHLLNEDTFTIKERSFSRDSDTGRSSVTVTNTREVNGSVQPASGKDTEMMDEGERTGNEWKAYTKAEVNTANQDSQEPSDLIEFEGQEYEVVHAEKYNAVIPHTKILMRREE